MQLRIRHDDEAGFERARDWLVGDLGRWLRDELRLDEETADTVAGDACLAIDWKFGYGDGDLGRWTASDVTEFLLGWCPRKLSVSQQDSVTIPGSVAALTDYLEARGLLARGSAPAAELRATVTNVAAEFVAEMGDPANFGMAKSLFTAAAEHGFDPTDETGLAAWMETFNSLSPAEREAILPDQAIGSGGPAGAPGLPSLPPVVLPPDEVVEASKAAAPVLGMFEKLAAFVGSGRRLTQNGNLGLADARELVSLLGTGDTMDERIGDRVFKTRSSSNLPVLQLVFAWAKKAGVVRVLHGKVLATKRGLALADDRAGLFDRALDALLAVGPLAAQNPAGSWRFWPEVDQVIDTVAVLLLIRPYIEQAPVPLAEITEVASRVVFSEFEFGELSDKRVVAHIGWNVGRLMDALELAGAVRRTSAPDSEDEPGPPLGEEVELTPAGLVAVRRLLAEAGYDTPVAGRFADAPATDLLTGMDPADWPLFAAEVDAWRERRTPEHALAELADAVRQLPDLASRNMAMAIMTEIGLDLAAPHIRKLADDGVARGLALCWLAEHGMVAERELYDPGDLDSFADVLAFRLVTAGQEGLLASLALAGDDSSQARLVSELGRSPAPPAGAVLEAIGRTHPSKVVAKSARKALFLRRSRTM